MAYQRVKHDGIKFSIVRGRLTSSAGITFPIARLSLTYTSSISLGRELDCQVAIQKPGRTAGLLRLACVLLRQLNVFKGVFAGEHQF